MKRMRNNFFTVLLFVTLTFSPILQFSHSAFGEESEACRPMYRPDKETLSAYLEVLRAYAFPPAWGNLDRGQDESPVHQIVAKWEARRSHYAALN